jgi:predicted dehydrogenase
MDHRIERREFLAAALAAPLAGETASPRIRTAFLGGAHPHGPAKVELVSRHPDFDLAGICETDAAWRTRFEKAGVRLLARDQILQDSSIELIVVDSRVYDHAADARDALRAGKHVHLEKAPTHDLASMREVIALARRKRRVLQTGYMWRHHPGINAALEAARQGWLGDIHFVRGTISTLIADSERAELARFPGGEMFELGGHLIDPLVRLLGAPRKVTPVLKKLGADGLADDTLAVFEFDRAIGTIQTSAMLPGASRHRSFEIFGSNGCAVLRPIEPPVLQIDLAKAAGPYKAGPQTVEMPEYKRYVADFAELAAAIRKERQLCASLEEEILVHQALLAASGMPA